MMKRVTTHLSMLAVAAILATGCAQQRHNLPPEQRLLEPGPGVGGPGPGVLTPPGYRAAPGPGAQFPGAPGGQFPGVPGAQFSGAPGAIPMAAAEGNPAVMQASYTAGYAPGPMIGPGAVPSTVQVTFGRPDGMQVRYDQSGAGMFDSEPMIVPARQNFPQGALYRVKLTNIPGRAGVELYPTIELAHSNPRTGAYLAHNSIPVQFTDEDFDQVSTGNFVTKVIYLPDPDFQGPALVGIDTIVSTRLDPGVDPIVEADRRGSILAIVRLGDKDIEMPGTGGLGSPLAMGPPIPGLPAPFAPTMSQGCGGVGSCEAGGGSCSGGSCGCNSGHAGPAKLPGMIAGVNAPQYGMPITGTPIGLPGPPHIPLGHKASVTKHVIRNSTPMHIPQPPKQVRINVRQQPGVSYPNPVSRVNIREQNLHPGATNGRAIFQHRSQNVDPNHQP